MRSRRTWRWLPVVVLAVTLGASAPAHGQSAGQLHVEVVGGGPAFDFSAIYPGATLTSIVRVSNQGTEAGSLGLSAVDVVDESRCSQAEVKAGMACGSGIGFLGAQMEFSIERLLAGGGSAPVWSGSIDQLVDVALGPEALAPAQTWEYRLQAYLPAWSGNETQADLLAFNLRFDLRGEGDAGSGSRDGAPSSNGPGGATEVLGSDLQRPGVSAGSGTRLLGGVLPRTGSGPLALVAGGGMLLLGGSVLLLASGRRGRTRPAVDPVP